MSEDLKRRVEEFSEHLVMYENLLRWLSEDEIQVKYEHFASACELIKELTAREAKLVEALKKTYKALQEAEGEINAAAFRESNNPPFVAGRKNHTLCMVRDALGGAQAVLNEIKD